MDLWKSMFRYCDEQFLFNSLESSEYRHSLKFTMLQPFPVSPCRSIPSELLNGL